ncbi:HMG (high mobility group) box domain-containing protein [Ditylenchus destructor]|uniref:HMG (High mobility group) box domain-containing protein n=1 Tax=Ditylenchus destructor TaxID=166010 RepID=A0AAD4NFP6_9BILA|nr:HMG (high mobility group) box domain-containing protein [Ditylenchus destructor]
MLSSDNNTNNHTASSPSPRNSLCEGSVSPSSIHSHSQPSTRELSSQHSLKNDTSSDDPTDFGSLHLPANIEMHPQNDSLSSSSRQQYIKRPLNAYMIWTRQERRKILNSDPKMKMNEVSKAVSFDICVVVVVSPKVIG